MNSELMLYIHGAIMVGCFFVGLKFLKFWYASRDRFFLWFASAFWVFAAGWVIRAFGTTTAEDVHYVYIPRLLAFLLIIAAILDKNRKAKRATKPDATR